MSPEIRINGQLIADTPDKTGTYTTTAGKPIYVDVEGIEASWSRQRVVIEAEEIGGQRVVGLTQEGRGISSDPKRGDGKLPEIEVVLHERPVRISYRDKHLWVERSMRTITLGDPRNRGYYTDRKRTYKNPYWIRDHG